MSNIVVRPEQARDREAVYRINEAAFGQPDEAALVDRLRERAAPYLGLVAERNGEVVGHIAFSPVTLDAQPDLDVRGLAPMAVLPEHQRTGVGGALISAGLEACHTDGAQAIIVLGHPAYYPRFGFVSAERFGLQSTYDVPPEAFMALELTPGVLDEAAGVARYDTAFGA